MKSSKATTPRAVLTWAPDGNVKVCASYSQGFRSGFPRRLSMSANYTSPQSIASTLGDAESDSILLARASFSVDGATLRQALQFRGWDSRVRALTAGVQIELKG